MRRRPQPHVWSKSSPHTTHHDTSGLDLSHYYCTTTDSTLGTGFPRSIKSLPDAVAVHIRNPVKNKMKSGTFLLCFSSRKTTGIQYSTLVVVVVVVVVVFFTLTGRASTIPSNIRSCQSGTWSQRGTKVNGSHHGDNPLLRPTGIQIATKSYATLQAMGSTNIKTVHQTSLLHISRAASMDSYCCRLPTTSVLSNKPDKLRSNQF